MEVEVPGLETIDWVMPNADAAGYYRWRVPPALFATLSTRAVEALSVRERLALLGNAAALLAAGELAVDDYLSLLGRSGGDPDPAVVGAVVEHLDRVKEPLGERVSAAAWAGFLRATLGPALERIGREPRAGESPETAVLRPLLIERLGRDGADPALAAWARSAAAPLLAGEPGGLDPALAGPALRLAALDGDRALFDRYLARFEAAATPAERARWLSALAAFRAPELTDAALGLIAAGKLRPNEIGDLLGALGAGGEKSDQLLDWSIAAFPMLAKFFPPEFLAFFPYFGSGCDLARYEKAKSFFGAAERKVGGTERTLAQVEDQVRSAGHSPSAAAPTPRASSRPTRAAEARAPLLVVCACAGAGARRCTSISTASAKPPFNLTPDPRFLFLSDRHREALDAPALRHPRAQGVHPDHRRGRRGQDHALPRRARAARPDGPRPP